ncbi:hypothetical protein U1Q18_040889 [Sarracenia purpurea var. burkii]
MEFSRFFWLEPPQGFNAGTYGFTLDEVPPDLRKLKVPLDLSPICVLQMRAIHALGECGILSGLLISGGAGVQSFGKWLAPDSFDGAGELWVGYVFIVWVYSYVIHRGSCVKTLGGNFPAILCMGGKSGTAVKV